MTTTMTPSIRPSSSTRTTSFDLRSARRRRGRWGPLPVWTGLFGGQCAAARGGLEDCQRMAEGNERHQAACTALRAFARSIDEVALRSRWPPIPSHRAGRDRRSTASTAARLGARSANLGQTAHYSQAIAHRSRGSGVVAKTRERRPPHRSPGLRGVARRHRWDHVSSRLRSSPSEPHPVGHHQADVRRPPVWPLDAPLAQRQWLARASDHKTRRSVLGEEGMHHTSTAGRWCRRAGDLRDRAPALAKGVRAALPGGEDYLPGVRAGIEAVKDSPHEPLRQD